MPLDQGDWSTAVPDWEDRILEGRSLIPDLPLFEPSAGKGSADLRSASHSRLAWDAVAQKR